MTRSPKPAQLAKLYVEDGRSIREIAARYDSTYSIMRRLLLQAGVTLRPAHRRRRKVVSKS